ncbi:MAG: transposase [Candidatus Omnitrophica bacterium]|nr:transposase [Candidatus Omnitrophota bacterium]
MPRIARIVAVGLPHHITQRGNYKQEIFCDESDRREYLNYIAEEIQKYKVKVLAYCLMKNHVHFIAVPEEETSIGNVFKYANMRYSLYFNRKRGVGGHLFQGRFFSSIMDEKHTLVCARYIERNPVRAKILKEPVAWQWSSARVHCGNDFNDFLGVNKLFNYIEIPKHEWKKFISEDDAETDIKEIKEQTRKGRPMASIEIMRKIEERLNRKLLVKPRGRPKTKNK